MTMKSIMWSYIDQEQEVLTRLMHCDEISSFAQEKGCDIEAMYIVAHGSSFNAAVSVSDFLARVAGLRVYAMTPANFCCSSASLQREERERTIVVAISQTGTSSGVIEALDVAKSWGFSTLGLTDVVGSPIATKAEWMLPLLCGKEDSNAKTKGYSATLLLLLRLAVELGLVRGIISQDRASTINNELSGMVESLPTLRDQVVSWCQRHDFGATMKDRFVLGSGKNFGTAQEGQLKLMETVCIPTMFNDIGEFSHGMHRSITPNSSVLVIRGANEYANLSEQAYHYLGDISNNVWMIDATGENVVDDKTICVGYFPETQSLLLTTLVVQVLSVYAPERQGLDPNRDAHNDFTDVVGTRVK